MQRRSLPRRYCSCTSPPLLLRRQRRPPQARPQPTRRLLSWSSSSPPLYDPFPCPTIDFGEVKQFPRLLPLVKGVLRNASRSVPPSVSPRRDRRTRRHRARRRSVPRCGGRGGVPGVGATDVVVGRCRRGHGPDVAGCTIVGGIVQRGGPRWGRVPTAR